jgi:hypothetical protein
MARRVRAFCSEIALAADLLTMRLTFLAEPKSDSTRMLLAIALAASTLTGLAACESTSEGRPASTKPSSKKSPAQWSMIEGADGEEEMIVVIERDEEYDDDDDDDGESNTRPGKRSREIRREIFVEGRPLPNAGPMGPGMQWHPVGGPNDVFMAGPMGDQMMIFGAASSAMIPPGVMPNPGQPPVAMPPAGPHVSQVPHLPPVMLGVRMREVDPVLATHLGLDQRKCAVLEDVSEELSGYQGGLRDHDIVVAIDGSSDASPSHVRRVLRSKKAGDTVKFDVRRSGGQAQSLTITLEPFDHGKLLSVTPARVGG